MILAKYVTFLKDMKKLLCTKLFSIFPLKILMESALKADSIKISIVSIKRCKN